MHAKFDAIDRRFDDINRRFDDMLSCTAWKEVIDARLKHLEGRA